MVMPWRHGTLKQRELQTSSVGWHKVKVQLSTCSAPRITLSQLVAEVWEFETESLGYVRVIKAPFVQIQLCFQSYTFLFPIGTSIPTCWVFEVVISLNEPIAEAWSGHPWMEKSWNVLELVSSKVCDAWSVGKGEEGGTMDQSWSATIGFVPLKRTKMSSFPVWR